MAWALVSLSFLVLNALLWMKKLLFMAALCNRADHYIFALWFLSFYLFFSSPNLISRRMDVYHTSAHDVVLVQN